MHPAVAAPNIIDHVAALRQSLVPETNEKVRPVDARDQIPHPEGRCMLLATCVRVSLFYSVLFSGYVVDDCHYVRIKSDDGWTNCPEV